jgi:hypothetical protein
MEPWTSGLRDASSCILDTASKNRIIGRTSWTIYLLESLSLYESFLSADSAVTWSSTLQVRTYKGCLYIGVENPRPEFEPVLIQGMNIPQTCNPEDLLVQHFPSTPDLVDIAAEFRHFEQPWKCSYPGDGAFNLTHPAFNRSGDLMFELRPACPRGAPPPASSRKTNGISGLNTQGGRAISNSQSAGTSFALYSA